MDFKVERSEYDIEIKPYMVFKYYDYEVTGLGDYRQGFDSLEEAEHYCKKDLRAEVDCDYQILCLRENKYISYRKGPL